MKDFLELAAQRYSCRKFSDKPVEEEKIRKIQQGISEKIELEANSSIKAKVVRVSARQGELKWNNKNTIIKFNIRI